MESTAYESVEYFRHDYDGYKILKGYLDALTPSEQIQCIIYVNNGKTALSVALDKEDTDGVLKALECCKDYIENNLSEPPYNVGFSEKDLYDLLVSCTDINTNANVLQRSIQIIQRQDSSSDKLFKKVYGCLKFLQSRLSGRGTKKYEKLVEHFILNKNNQEETTLHTAASHRKTGKFLEDLLDGMEKVQKPRALNERNKNQLTPLAIGITEKSIEPDILRKYEIHPPNQFKVFGPYQHILFLADMLGEDYVIAVLEGLPRTLIEHEIIRNTESGALQMIMRHEKDQCRAMDHLAENFEDKLTDQLRSNPFQKWLRRLQYKNSMRNSLLKALLSEEERFQIRGKITSTISEGCGPYAILFYNGVTDSEDDADFLEKTLRELHFEVKDFDSENWTPETLCEVLEQAVSRMFYKNVPKECPTREKHPFKECSTLVVCGITHGKDGYLLKENDPKRGSVKIGDVEEVLRKTGSIIPVVLILDSCRVFIDDKPEESNGESTDDKPEESNGESTDDKPEESNGESTGDKPEESNDESTGDKNGVITFHSCSKGEESWGGGLIHHLAKQLKESKEERVRSGKEINLISELKTVQKLIESKHKFYTIICTDDWINWAENPVLASLEADSLKKMSCGHRHVPMVGVYSNKLDALREGLKKIPENKDDEKRCKTLLVIGIRQITSSEFYDKPPKAKNKQWIEKLIKERVAQSYTDPETHTYPISMSLADRNENVVFTMLGFHPGVWEDDGKHFQYKMGDLREAFLEDQQQEFEAISKSNSNGTVTDAIKYLDKKVCEMGLDQAQTKMKPMTPEFTMNNYNVETVIIPNPNH